MTRLAIALIMALMILMLTACGAPTATPSAPRTDISSLPDTLTVAQAQPLLANPGVFWLDVREQSEYDAGHIPGITLIPSGEVTQRLAEIPKDKPVIVTCHSGNRSGKVTQLLREQGYTNVHNMEGGIAAWQQAGYSVEK